MSRRKSSSPAPSPLPASPPRRTARVWSVLIAVALLVGVGYGAWSWRQYARPGQAHYRRGVDDAAERRFHDAEREWLDGTREDPTFPGCYERLGDLYQQVHDFPDAADNYAHAAQLSPHDGTLFLRLARTEQSMGNNPAAAKAAKRAYEMMPDDADTVSLYGILAAKQKNTPEALAALRRAHRMRPDNRDDLMGLVNLEMDIPDMAAAERDLAPWLQAHADDAEACYFMGVIDNQKPRTHENVAEGMNYARQAVAGMPRDPRTHALLGQFELDTHHPQEALRTYLAAAQLLPNDEGILHGLVRCYTLLGRPQQAEAVARHLQTETTRHNQISHLQEVMRFNHTDFTHGLELARLEEEDGDISMAQTYYVTLVREAPHDPRPRTALVALLKRQGRMGLARQAADPNFVP